MNEVGINPLQHIITTIQNTLARFFPIQLAAWWGERNGATVFAFFTAIGIMANIRAIRGFYGTFSRKKRRGILEIRPDKTLNLRGKSLAYWLSSILNGSSVNNDENLCFISCIGQTGEDEEERVLNQIAGPLSNRKFKFPSRKEAMDSGEESSVFESNPVRFSVGRGGKYSGVVHCLDLNADIDEEDVYSALVEYCWLLSSVVIIVVEVSVEAKILDSLSRLPEHSGRNVTAVFLFLNWDLQEVAPHLLGQLMYPKKFEEEGSQWKCDDKEEIQALLETATTRFSKVVLGFSNANGTDLNLFSSTMTLCDPLVWNGRRSFVKDKQDVLLEAVRAVNTKIRRNQDANPLQPKLCNPPQQYDASPGDDALAVLRQHGVFAKTELALSMQFLNGRESVLPLLDMKEDVKRNLRQQHVSLQVMDVYEQFMEDVSTVQRELKENSSELEKTLMTIILLSDAEILERVNQIKLGINRVQFQFPPEEENLREILTAATNRMIHEFQVKCSMHSERQVLHTNKVIDHVLQQYESFMKTATTESYFSDKQFKKMHNHILDALEPKLTRLRGFETRQEEVKNQFKELFNRFKDENTKRVRQFQREREGAIKSTLKTLRVLNELMPGLKANQLTKAGWEIFTTGAKDPKSAKLYAEEVAAAIRDEVKDMTGNVDEDAVFCLEDFECTKSGLYLPDCLREVYMSRFKVVDVSSNSGERSGQSQEEELRRELQETIDRVDAIFKTQEAIMGSVMAEYTADKLKEAKTLLRQTGAGSSVAKLRQIFQHLQLLEEKLV